MDLILSKKRKIHLIACHHHNQNHCIHFAQEAGNTFASENLTISQQLLIGSTAPGLYTFICIFAFAYLNFVFLFAFVFVFFSPYNFYLGALRTACIFGKQIENFKFNQCKEL